MHHIVIAIFICSLSNLHGILVNAAYCTGLLLARRVLKKFGLDEEYVGNAEVCTLIFKG